MSLTEKKKLQSGAPVWTAYPLRIPIVERLPRDVRIDVLVVGAGLRTAAFMWIRYRERYAGAAPFALPGPLRNLKGQLQCIQ
jgi:hypothetical protein